MCIRDRHADLLPRVRVPPRAALLRRQRQGHVLFVIVLDEELAGRAGSYQRFGPRVLAPR
eukprot:11594211-Alexandrium_andersonii.AAC.1